MQRKDSILSGFQFLQQREIEIDHIEENQFIFFFYLSQKKMRCTGILKKKKGYSWKIKTIFPLLCMGHSHVITLIAPTIQNVFYCG